MNWSSFFSQPDNDRKVLFVVNSLLIEREEKLLLEFKFSSLAGPRGSRESVHITQKLVRNAESRPPVLTY